MQIQTLILGACHTNCYLVSDENQNAVIIDPADDAPSILRAAQGLRVHNLLVTHGHTDHILALEAVRQRLGAPIVISKADAWRLESETLINQRPYVTIPYRAVKADIQVDETSVLTVGALSFRFFPMPGHTEGSMAIFCGGAVFTGDTLLKRGRGIVTLPGADEPLLNRSLRRLASIPGDYDIYPGHGPRTMLAQERAENPYLCCAEQK